MITPEEIKRIADLARLNLPSDRVPVYAEQLKRIVAYVGMLNEVDTTNLAPLAHASSEGDVFRDDTVVPGLTRAEALANSADADGVYFRVPKTV